MMRANISTSMRSAGVSLTPAASAAFSMSFHASRCAAAEGLFLDKHSPSAAAHLEAWKDIEKAAEAAGVKLTPADRIDVEMLARIMARCRRLEPQSSDFASYDKF